MKLFLLTTLFFLTTLAHAQTEFRSCRVLGPVVQGGRNLLHKDPIEAMIVAGKAIDTTKWHELTANKDGWFESDAFSGGYADISLPSVKEQVVLLEAMGHTVVYINGVPRTGDPYSNGYVRLPIPLHKGENSLLFVVSRGRLHVSIKPVTKPLVLDASDATLTDFRVGESLKSNGAIVLINASNQWQKHLSIVTTAPDGFTTTREVPTIPPMSIRKIAIGIKGDAPKKTDPLKYTSILIDGRGKQVADPLEITLSVKNPADVYKRTFISEIDGSVQYYAVNPASDYVGKHSKLPPPALVLSLHGASVEGAGQASAYASKSWAHIVAPTNRRPYGFDWEEIGRLDALEVLGLAQKELKTDPSRTYLTGHSMGGHGTWQIGVQYPDKFAALAPSAGWVSFFSYAGTQKSKSPSSMDSMILRATNASDTMALSHNYSQQSIYALHGDADDNVPVTEARTMIANLGTFHKDFQIHEQPGAGHWWSIGDEPGARCVDWPGFFDLFAKRRIPAMSEVRHVDFSTANPEVSSHCHWATVEQQDHPLEISSAVLDLDPHLRRFSGSTKNVHRLQLNLAAITGSEPVNIDIDGTKVEKIPIGKDMFLNLIKEGARWKSVLALSPTEKNPMRSGNFKSVFNHRFCFVVGTQGSVAENEWALNKATFDAETFWYRGNGSVDIFLDTDFNPIKDVDRSVILYGNAETNSVWKQMLKDSDISVSHDTVQIGIRKFSGDNLAVMFLKPRPNSVVAYVGAISGTGLSGMRLTERVPIFLSGVGIPDCIVMSPETLSNGVAGVKAAGFFGNDWSVANGEFVFGE